MKKIERFYKIEELISQKRVLVIYGPRRSGKTTLLNEFLKNTGLKYKLDTGDNIRTQKILSSQDIKLIKEYAVGYELIAIDEAQHIDNIGMGLKILNDYIPELYIIATGSSSFDLSQKVGEPLTGRKRTVILFPVSQIELYNHFNKFELKEKLNDFLIYGTYPEVLTAQTYKEKRFILQELVESYLLKDILSLERIKSGQKLMDLLKLLAFQIGNEVSLNELANSIGMDVKTIARYLDLLEKGFVIKRINGFSRNLRNEITSKSKYYFLDNGIRNAVISQFNRPEDRNDKGALFENFIFTERIKLNAVKERYVQLYFWRTHFQQEIDIIEEYEGKLSAYEIKWNPKIYKLLPPASWKKAYPDASFKIININNYLDFVI